MDTTELRLACLKLAADLLRSDIGAPPDEVLALAKRFFDFITQGQLNGSRTVRRHSA